MKLRSILNVLVLAIALTGVVGLVGCDSDQSMDSDKKMMSYDKPGFKTFVEDGRLWVFKDGSDALMEFEKSGEPAKSVTKIGAGPEGMTIKSVDTETIEAYMAAGM